MITVEQLDNLLSQWQWQGSDQMLLDLAEVEQAKVEGSMVSFSLIFAIPVISFKAELSEALKAKILELDSTVTVQIEIKQNIRSAQAVGQQGLQQVKNIVAVASGKGGVGKSTTTVNLALAMAAEGARVGILDADIYGPSQGMMLGVAEGTRPDPAGENGFYPISAHGVESMSISYLIEENTPMVWRGPMASSALQQLLTQTIWSQLDYLFIDMPPGTGDIQLTLSQKVPVTGALVVTTPQDIALLDAQKGIEMFRKVDIPVLGVVENMSMHICSQCGHAEPIFGTGGGDRIAQQYQTDLLGQLPLALSIREQADSGLPTVVADPEGANSQLYRQLAQRVAIELAVRNAQPVSVIPAIQVEND